MTVVRYSKGRIIMSEISIMLCRVLPSQGHIVGILSHGAKGRFGYFRAVALVEAKRVIAECGCISGGEGETKGIDEYAKEKRAR